MSESIFFSEQTKLVADFFETWHNHSKIKSESDEGRSRYCQIFDAFNEFERSKHPPPKEGEVVNFHNCIGCNFEEGCQNILDFTKVYSGTQNIRTYLTIYTLLFYTVAERMAVIYQELGVINGKHFDWTQFPVLRKIKHWANFFKHPKAYMFLHHPGYFLETDPEKPNLMIEGEVDSPFVDLFYKAGADNIQLRQLFENKKGWNIIFPDLLPFTQQLCNEIDNACEYILKPENMELLSVFTLKDY